MLRTVDLRPSVVVYTKNQIPFTKSSLNRLLHRLPHNEFPRALMREDELKQLRSSTTTPAATAKLLHSNAADRDAMIELMVAHPELIRRPIVEFVNYGQWMSQPKVNRMQEKEFEHIRQVGTE